MFQKEEEKVIKIKPVQTVEKQNEDKHKQLHEQSKLKHMKEELKQLEQHKNKILQEAAAQIEQEKKSWKQEKAQWIEQSKQQGYQAGFEQGKQAGIAQYEQQIDKANAIVETATKDYYTTVEASDDTIIELAIHTAEKILKNTLSNQPEAFIPIVTAAISELKDQSRLAIYLHPNNYEYVVNQKEDLMQLLDGDTALSIFIDRQLSENDCLIVHPFGQIDVGIDTQLQQIAQALQEVSGEQRHE